MSDLETISSEGRLAFVAARWHADLIESCRTEFLAESERLGTPAAEIDLFEVAGAFEIPLTVKRLAASGRYRARGLLGAGRRRRHLPARVRRRRGDRRPDDGPARDRGAGDLRRPHPASFHEHETHRDFFREHLRTKGAEAAQACHGTIDALAALPA